MPKLDQLEDQFFPGNQIKSNQIKSNQIKSEKLAEIGQGIVVINTATGMM